jgi:hypothetical protein
MYGIMYCTYIYIVCAEGGEEEGNGDGGKEREGEADMRGNGGEKEVLSCTHLL